MHFEESEIIVITPVYEDLEASSRLFMELQSTLGAGIYIVAVDDGSINFPLDASALHDANAQGEIIKLTRNVGHQTAIAIGLDYVTPKLLDHHVVVIMDSDGEDLPSSIPSLINQLSEPRVDAVVASRGQRVESFKFKSFYRVYTFLFAGLTGKKISFGNFMALKPNAAKRLVTMNELSTHVAAALLASKLRISHCQLDRGPRYAGQSKMNFVGLALHGFKALMIFAEDVLVRVGIACAGIASLSIIGGIIALTLKALGLATPGWFSVVFGVLILIFLQTGALTLMTLMLTGIAKRNVSGSQPSYKHLISKVLR